MKMNFSRYERLYDHTPHRLIATHPSGRFVALETYHNRRSTVAIWAEDTGKIVWAQENVETLAWLKHGSEIVLLADRPSTEKSEQVYEQRSFLFERRTWPDTTFISSCEVSFPWCAPENMLVSPHENLVVMRWLDEGVSGWEFVILSDAGDFQVQGAGFEISGPAALYASPSFSPDGRYAISDYHTKFVEDKKGYTIPLQRGHFEVGCITVICIAAGTFHEITLSDVVRAKLHGTASQSLDEPVFLDNERFMTMLPTGAKRTYSVKSH